MHKQAGMEGRPLLFLLDHAQVTDEAMLDDLHALLNTGEVPGLFSAEERGQGGRPGHRTPPLQCGKSLPHVCSVFSPMCFMP